MLDKIKELIGDVQSFTASTQKEVEVFRIKYLGSKGLLKELFTRMTHPYLTSFGNIFEEYFIALNKR